jgi:hypothetical protein
MTKQIKPIIPALIPNELRSFRNSFVSLLKLARCSLPLTNAFKLIPDRMIQMIPTPMKINDNFSKIITPF